MVQGNRLVLLLHMYESFMINSGTCLQPPDIVTEADQDAIASRQRNIQRMSMQHRRSHKQRITSTKHG